MQYVGGARLLKERGQAEEAARACTGGRDTSALSLGRLQDIVHGCEKRVYVYDEVTLPEGQPLQAPISSDYAAVVWFTGFSRDVKDADGHVVAPNLTVADRVYLEEYLEQGGKLFLSGWYAWCGIDGSDFFRKHFCAYFVNEIPVRALEPNLGAPIRKGSTCGHGRG